mmetsp:Transcript_1623/g.5669  ORF Transcript_1623/g.5669 Transcript_1623/m.5669 type:complete len:552 (-) Transcript_1623:131-1786(-)
MTLPVTLSEALDAPQLPMSVAPDGDAPAVDTSDEKPIGKRLLSGTVDAEMGEAERTAEAEAVPYDAAESEAALRDYELPPPPRDAQDFSERAKHIPLRLTLAERKQLRLLESALFVSEYTDKVDVISYRNKAQRVHAQLKDVCAILSGLLVASDYKQGQRLIRDRSFAENAEFFQGVFEVGRRHKIMNPEKMRAEYGKLIYLLQDSQQPEIRELLEFALVKPISSVAGLLEEHGALGLLKDPYLEWATAEVRAEGKSRHEINQAIKRKEKAQERIVAQHARGALTEEQVRRCLYSIGDNNAFLRENREPVDVMIAFLKEHFHPTKAEAGYSLAISGGRQGARLTHSHERQYHYVLQSLSLWQSTLDDFFRLWHMAEDDLLDPRSPYRLRDTGQGLNRVQQCPRVYKAMHHIISVVQRKVGSWVGSSVVHLGDNNVPNALLFIDKYTQISRILYPVTTVLRNLEDVARRDANLRKYIDATFGGVAKARKDILADFFRHAFDGSGADNFFDAGSCIDGRLTSAWNWCSKLEKKSYFPLFLLTGFVGFDGSFQR